MTAMLSTPIRAHSTDYIDTLYTVAESLEEQPQKLYGAIRSVVDTVQECRDEVSAAIEAHPEVAAALLPTLTKLRRLARTGH
ncbi:hypothetical protein [Azospirillum tabaci]|uniref:hypothetical protein n=1 Tax=Azospirillum tabaci TaxID=2752310 RepID=UPI001660771E|nr:hypothetical protein [Azospirillum tabaci]